MRLFRGFAVAAAVLAFAIAVLGSWVRINGAGLTCPDWPLCHGQLVPSLAGGVILEWSHRLVAFVESFVVLGAIVTGWRVRDRIRGVTPALGVLAAIFLVQVLLGGATVLLSNSPLSVALHWGTGMALLATLTLLAVLAATAPARDGLTTGGPATPALIGTTAVAFCTMCIGAYVSSSYAGLACVTFPACDGTLFGANASQTVQMLHRFFAFATAFLAAYAAMISLRSSARTRSFAIAGCALVAVQIVLGAANVVWQLPIVLREAHAANAAATFIIFTLAATFSTLEMQPATHTARDRSAPARRIATNT